MFLGEYAAETLDYQRRQLRKAGLELLRPGESRVETPPLGDQELEVLRYISNQAPVTARAVAEHFASSRGLARTTVLTVIERLRKKGYLDRRHSEGQDGIYVYAPRVDQSELSQSLVQNFVERTLGGSVSPVVAYLAQSRSITDEDLGELQQLLDSLKETRRRASEPEQP